MPHAILKKGGSQSAELTACDSSHPITNLNERHTQTQTEGTSVLTSVSAYRYGGGWYVLRMRTANQGTRCCGRFKVSTSESASRDHSRLRRSAGVEVLGVNTQPSESCDDDQNDVLRLVFRIRQATAV